jgi:hypothetical protein
VRFDLNDYSIPHTLVKKPLTLQRRANRDPLRGGIVIHPGA